MDIEIIEDATEPNVWRVEAIDPEDGGIEVAIFSGPRAEDRARDFARTYYDATRSK